MCVSGVVMPRRAHFLCILVKISRIHYVVKIRLRTHTCCGHKIARAHTHMHNRTPTPKSTISFSTMLSVPVFALGHFCYSILVRRSVSRPSLLLYALLSPNVEMKRRTQNEIQCILKKISKRMLYGKTKRNKNRWNIRHKSETKCAN